MDSQPVPLGPIDAIDAMERVEFELIELLRELSPEDWNRPTIVKPWRVRHVAGHLLDTALRKLSMVRDGFFAEGPASGEQEDVRRWVDRVNAAGAAVYARLSPEVLTSLMRVASRELCDWHRAADPDSPAIFPVSWAGERASAQWFDTARELTERWHHQEQIRIAVGRRSLITRDLYYPVLDCFMRVLPYTYRQVTAPPGASVLVKVAGDSGGEWRLWRDKTEWRLVDRLPGPPAAAVTVPEAIAWRLFTKGIGRNEAESQIEFQGDRLLASHVLGAIAIVG